MGHRYMVIAWSAVALCGYGCEGRSEVVARERFDAGGAGPIVGDGDGSSGGDGDGDTGGTSGDGDGEVSAATMPRFAAPSPVDGLNDPVAKDQDPTVTADQLEIFFFSDRSGNADIWTAKRASPDAGWDAPVPVAELNTAEIEQNPAISRDGLRLWFYSRTEPLGIYFTQRLTRDDPFDPPQPVAIGPIADPEAFPIGPTVDMTELRMAVSIGAAASRDLYEVVRASPSGMWSEPSALTGVNTDEYAESTPFLIDEGRAILFHSGRVGRGDLFWGHRESPGLPFTQVAPLNDVNDPIGFESHPHLTADGRWLYFGSDRDGNTDIYVAEAIQQ